MKLKVFLILFLPIGLFFNSCGKCKKECFNFWDGERMMFYDSLGKNVLNPNNGNISIDYFRTIDGLDVEFNVKNYVVDQNAPEGVWHFETISDIFPLYCLDKNCKLLIKLSHRTSVDTVSMRIDKITKDCCIDYVTQNFSYNGEEINEKDSIIGGYVVRLE